jgi:TPP-dependent pyruvate/acetoin dehydrogenase alpha subunit
VTAADLIAFENRIRAHWEAGDLPCLLHLCGGNEKQLVRMFSAMRPDDWVFSTHRNHYHALLKGIPPDQLEAAILSGHSMFTFSREHNFYSSAILAGACCIAAGVAYDIKARGGTECVYCFLGDGAEEQGHFYEAALFVEANDLPCIFIIEDNNRQVDTDKFTRRGDARAMTIKGGCAHFANAYKPLDHFRCVRRYHYTPTYPHAGSGAKPGTITFKPEAIARIRESVSP